MRTCAPSRQTELTNKLRCLGNISVLPTRSGIQLLLHGVFAAKYAILCKTHVQMLITIILCRLSAWFHWANCGNAWNRNGNMNCFATKCFVWSCDLLRIRKGSEVTMNSVAVMCFGIRFGWCSKRLRHHLNQSDRRNSFLFELFRLERCLQPAQKLDYRGHMRFFEHRMSYWFALRFRCNERFFARATGGLDGTRNDTWN